MFAQIVFAVLFAVTPHCHVGQVTDCHYSDSVSVTVPGAVVWAEVHNGQYEVTVYP